MFKLKKTDKIIITFAVLIIMLLSYLLFDDSLLNPTNKTNLQSNMGTLYKSNNDVRRKKEDTFSWIPAEKKDFVFENDSLFTGENSTATLLMNDGSKVSIEPNSLIILKKQKGQMTLNLQYGNLVSEIKQGSVLTIQSDKDEIQVGSQKNKNQSKVSFKKSRRGSISLKVVEGEAQITKNNKLTEVKKNESLMVSQKGDLSKAKEVAIHLLSPHLENFQMVSQQQSLEFKWNFGANTNTAVGHSTLQISSQPDFSLLNYSASTKLKTHKVIGFRKTGRYYWRIQALDNDGNWIGESKHSFFDLQFVLPPVWVTPLLNANYNLELPPNQNPMIASIDLECKADEKSDSRYEWQLATDSKFEHLVDQQISKSAKIQSRALESGQYYARVRSFVKNINTEWSETNMFSLNLTRMKLPPPPAPILLTENISFKPVAAQGRNPASLAQPQMQWQSLVPAKKFKLQISRRSDFKTAAEVDTQDPFYIWSKYRPGQYYFRVYLLGENNIWSNPSNAGTLNVQLDQPVIDPLAEVVVKDHSFNATPPEKSVQIQWTEIPFAEKYKVEIKNLQSKISKSQTFEVSQNRASFKVRNPSSYQIQVVPLDEKNKPLTLPSAPADFKYTFRSLLETPKILFPQNQFTLFLQKDNSVDLKIRWQNVKRAQAYKLEVSEFENFQTTLLQETVSGTHFLMQKKLPYKKLYWRVKAKAEFINDDSDWTDKQAFTLYQKKNDIFE